MHCKIIDCYFNIFFVEMQVKKENTTWKVFWGAPKLVCRYSKQPEYVTVMIFDKLSLIHATILGSRRPFLWKMGLGLSTYGLLSLLDPVNPNCYCFAVKKIIHINIKNYMFLGKVLSVFSIKMKKISRTFCFSKYVILL